MQQQTRRLARSRAQFETKGKMVEAEAPRHLGKSLAQLDVRLYVDEFGSEFLCEVGIHSPACSTGEGAIQRTAARSPAVSLAVGSMPSALAAAVATPKGPVCDDTDHTARHRKKQ